MKLFLSFAKVAFLATSWAVTLCCWLWEGVTQLFFITSDIRRSRRTYRDGILHCPNGHPIEPAGVFQCPACSWTYRDEAYGLVCPNPECDRPYTNIVQCTVCGESQRNPLRFGRR